MTRAMLPMLAGAMLPALAGCTTTPPAAPADRVCAGEPGQAFIGRIASVETGTALLAATGSSELRWVPPNGVVTMDFKPSRVTVSYDNAMRIVRVSCG